MNMVLGWCETVIEATVRLVCGWCETGVCRREDDARVVKGWCEDGMRMVCG